MYLVKKIPLFQRRGTSAVLHSGIGESSILRMTGSLANRVIHYLLPLR